MVLGSAALLATAAVHVVLCPLLVFGWGDGPGLGVAGAAVSTLVANAASCVVLLGFLLSGRGGVQLLRAPVLWRSDLLPRILRVGLPASVNPIISNASIAVSTAYMASFGTAAVAGYGVAARLEYILVPIAFGFGGTLTAMVATNLGAGQRQRALHAIRVGATIVLGVTGAIGVAAAVWPTAWMELFTSDPAVRDAGAQYLRIVGGAYGFFGLGLALFFASQGTGQMHWPVLASTMRLVIVAAGGWVCLYAAADQPEALYAVVAASFMVYAATMGLAVWKGTAAIAQPRTPVPGTMGSR
jgi:Na+-driven multidrug efflux pump